MDFENMMKFFQFFQMMQKSMEKEQKPDVKEQKPDVKEQKTEVPGKKPEDMTAAERLDALEKMYAKREEEDALLKRIEALEKRAPKVTTKMPEPMGLDGILKGMIPGMMNGEPEDKGGK